MTLATDSDGKKGRGAGISGLARFLAVAGPGLVVMLADTDAGSVITAAQSGAQWGYKLLLLQLILAPILYVVQELTVRLGVVTRKGHAQLIKEQFGAAWAWVSVGTLVLSCIGALLTEFSGLSGVGSLTGSGSGAQAFKISVSGNVVTQSFIDGSGALWTFNINGQSYNTTVQNFDKTGNLTSIDYKGVTGAPYNEFQYFYTGTNATGYTSTGLGLYYSGQASGLTEVDLDGSGNLTRALYTFPGTAPGSQTGFEADYVAGEAAGSLASYLAPAGANYSTYVAQFDNANHYVGAVYTSLSTGQTYDEAQYS